jgi:predicted nucleotidyltransferase
MTTDARVALERLRGAIDAGDLDDGLERLGVSVMGAFGSAARSDSVPLDLDVGVRFDGPVHLLEVIDLLVATTGYDRIDVAVIEGEHPVLDAAALTGIPLYDREKSGYAALGHLRDTANFRRLDLELLTR